MQSSPMTTSATRPCANTEHQRTTRAARGSACADTVTGNCLSGNLPHNCLATFGVSATIPGDMKACMALPTLPNPASHFFYSQ